MLLCAKLSAGLHVPPLKWAGLVLISYAHPKSVAILLLALVVPFAATRKRLR